MAYHSKGIGKNKAIREQCKKPLPLQLMRPTDAKTARCGRGQRAVEKNFASLQAFQSKKGGSHGQGFEE